LVASESQPRRSCEVTISLISEGDDVGRSTTFDVEVFAYVDDVSSSSTNDGEDDSVDSGLKVESNTLPGFLALEAVLIFATVGVIGRKRSTP